MDFPRTFLAHTTNGRTWQGCRFGIGYVVVMPLDTTGPDGWFVGASLSALTDDPNHLMHGARIEWPTNDTPETAP